MMTDTDGVAVVVSLSDRGTAAVERRLPVTPPWPQRHRHRPTGRLLRQIGAGLLVVAIGLAVWAAGCAYLAARHLQSVRDEFTAAAGHGTAVGLTGVLTSSRQEATAASRLLAQPGPRLVAMVPVLGRSIAAETAVATAADAVLAAADPLLTGLQGLGRDGGVDLDRLAALETQLRQAARRVAGPVAAVSDVDTALTPPMVGQGVQAARDALDGVGQQLRHAADAAGAMRVLLGADGPRTLLIGLSNNAELRGSGGLVSVYALVTTQDGRIGSITFQQVDAVKDGAANAVEVAAPADYRMLYGQYLANSTLWQNTTMSPDVPETGQVLAEVARQSTGVTVDGVVLLDVPAMADLVTATGDLHLADGSTLAGSDLTHAVLVDAYGDGRADLAYQDARRTQLVSIAQTAFGRLTSVLRAGTGSNLAVFRALSDAVSGRHLALWANDPSVQSSLAAAGLAGSADPHGSDVVLATVNNLGDGLGHGNKLDYYVHRSQHVQVVVDRSRARVTQTITLTNDAPNGLGPYVAGSAPVPTVLELVDLSVDQRAQLRSFTVDGAAAKIDLYRANGSTIVRHPVTLAQGTTRTLQVVYDVPVVDGTYRLSMLPQPLATPGTLDLQVQAADGMQLAQVSGMAVHGKAATSTGVFDASRTVTVKVAGRGRIGRLLGAVGGLLPW